MQDVIDIKSSKDESRSSEVPVSPSGGSDAIRFKLQVFEGPLDLLLHLIKTDKIDIYDIPIVHITQQYLEYLELMEEMNLEIAGDFLVMAATLIHIKSRTLLPLDAEEPDDAIDDPRAELVERLLEYKMFQDVTGKLRNREDVWKNIFHRNLTEADDLDLEPETGLFEVSVFDLITAFRTLLTRTPEQVLEITRDTLTVSDRINYIMERLEREDGVRFLELFADGYTKASLIVTFLALLELNRLGLARAYQEKAFGVIWIINPHKADAVRALAASSGDDQDIS
jgi:segregation and condensation protein A